MTHQRKPTRFRRLLRGTFSLRTLMIALTICCVVLGWYALRLKQVSMEQAALEELRAHIAEACENYEFYSRDGDRERLEKLEAVEVKYDYQFGWDGKFDPNRQPWGPKWMQVEPGKNSLARIVSLSISTNFRYNRGRSYMNRFELDQHADCNLSSLDFLLQFPNLRELTLDIGMEPDFDLSALGRLNHLERLEFTCTTVSGSNDQVTDLPLADIANARNLKYLRINGNATPADVPIRFQLRELKFLPRNNVVSAGLGLASFGDLSLLESLDLRGLKKYRPTQRVKGLGLETTSELSSLRHLKLDGEVLTLDPFLASPIEELWLDCEPFKDFSVLSGFKKLRKLSVSGNFDSIAEPLQLPALEKATIWARGDCGLEKFSTPRLKELNYLHPQSNHDLSQLEQLPGLRVLKLYLVISKGIDLALDQIRDLTIVFFYDVESEKLRFLTRDDCRLEKLNIFNYYSHQIPVDDLECLRHAKQLRSVKLEGLSIADIDFLNGVQKLERVDLLRNQNLSNINGLTHSLPVLKELHLSENTALLDHRILASPAPKLDKLTIRNRYRDKPTRRIVNRLANHPIKLNSPRSFFQVLSVPGFQPVNETAWKQRRDEEWAIERHLAFEYTGVDWDR